MISTLSFEQTMALIMAVTAIITVIVDIAKLYLEMRKDRPSAKR